MEYQRDFPIGSGSSGYSGYSGYSASSGSSGSSGSLGSSGSFDSPGSSGSPGSPGSPDGMESVDQLDQSLDDSLGEFDAEVSGQSGNDRTSEIDILRPSGGSTLESDAEQPIYDDAGSIAEGDEALENRASEGPSESEAAAEGSSNSDSTISVSYTHLTLPPSDLV